LLAINPNYLSKYPGLLFPGKDDKSTNPRKVRARVSFELLQRIAAWRVVTIEGPAKAEEGAVAAAKPAKVLEI
jgi:Restriction endonuclease BglI